ncbi:MAG: Mfa1 family fimbria major subunit [Rikenellaceae bacterium]|nr:Mfa1 family fimbria major subunit [Rikenellaceae bacterium]
MKLRKLFFALLAVSVLLSCSKEAGEVTDIEFEGEKTSLVITLSVDDNNVKAITFPDNASTSAEKRIYNAVAVVFDHRGLLEAVADYDEFTNGGDEASDITLDFEEITTGVHEFYVIANAPRSLLQRQGDLFPMGMTLSDFKKEYHDLTSVGVAGIVREKTGYEQGDESGESRGFFMTSLPDVNKITLATEGNNALTIELYRVAAKVSVGYDPDSNGEMYGHLEDIYYEILNNPTRMYVFSNITDNQVYTPYFNENYNASHYVGGLHDYRPAIVAGQTGVAEDELYTYCVENSNLKALKGNSTRVRIKAVFVPAQLKDENEDDMGAGTGGTFWRIREVSTGMWESDYYGEVPASIPAGYEAVEYTDGVCYYNTWLYNNTYNQYMVKRNTYVKVSITAVFSAGEPGEEEGVDPTDPIEETTDATISVSVAEWEGEEQKVIL